MLLDYLWDWISTHAPHAGSDTTSIRPMAACPNFNSRSPCRERPLVAGKEMLLLLFQSTLPLRGATTIVELVSGLILFQPTLPMRGATQRHQDPYGSHQISTHAPHAGSDIVPVIEVPQDLKFQPTLPMRGATGSLTSSVLMERRFQPTLPMRGATANG